MLDCEDAGGRFDPLGGGRSDAGRRVGSQAAERRAPSAACCNPSDYSASGSGRIWKRTISLVIPLPPSWCQFVTES